jgi:hypothetical protein
VISIPLAQVSVFALSFLNPHLLLSPRSVAATIVIAALSVFVMPIVYLLGLRHDISSAIATLAFGVGGILVMVIVFGEKFISLLKLKRYGPKVLDETQQTSQSLGSNTFQLFSQEVIRSMQPDEQFEYYTKVIQKYTALRLQLDCPSERSSHASNQNYNLPEGAVVGANGSAREIQVQPLEEC